MRAPTYARQASIVAGASVAASEPIGIPYVVESRSRTRAIMSGDIPRSSNDTVFSDSTIMRRSISAAWP